MKVIIEAAGALGSTGLIFVPAFNNQKSLPDKEARELLLGQMKELGDFALQHKTRILLEPLNRQEMPKEEKTLWVKIPSKDDVRLQKIDKILQMFEGEERMIIYCEDTQKRLSARCLIHDSLVKELKEMFGIENVVVK